MAYAKTYTVHAPRDKEQLMRDDKHVLSVSEALEMYKRLRERGQNSILARLSVEACVGSEMNPQQRKDLRDVLRSYETSAVNAA
jgi:hypothetical protein